MAKNFTYEDKVIDGKNVKVVRQGLRSRIKTKAVVLSIAGPAIAKACMPILDNLKGDGDKPDLKNINIGDIDLTNILVPAVEGLSESISDDKLLKLIDTLMSGVYVDDIDVSDPDKFEAVFETCMGTMYKVCAFAAKVNFSDLMSDLSTLIGLQGGEKEQTEQKDSVNS